MADDGIALAASGYCVPARHDRHQAGDSRARTLSENHHLRQRNRFYRVDGADDCARTGGVEFSQELREDQRYDGSHLR